MESYQGKNDNQVVDSENLVMSSIGILVGLILYFLGNTIL